jgi:predicted RND superfamily exporter protein
VQSELTGIDTLAYSLDTHRANGIHEPQYLSAMASFVDWLQQQPEVVHVDSIIPLLKSLNRSMHGDVPEWYRVPEEPDLVSQYLLLYEMSLGFGQDLSNQIKADKSASLINLRLRVDKAKEIIDLDQRAQAWLAKNAPELSTHGASISLMFAYLGKNNIENMMIGNYWIIGMMVVTLIIGFSSFRFGLLSLLPNLSPAVIALGIWYLLDGEINIAVAVVFSVTLGIVVDDTIHFINRYLEITRSGIASGADAVRLTLNSVGNALVITSVVLASGFAVLGLSDFNVNAALGQMVSLTIIMALLFDLAFLPALLVLVQRGAKHVVNTP